MRQTSINISAGSVKYKLLKSRCSTTEPQETHKSKGHYRSGICQLLKWPIGFRVDS